MEFIMTDIKELQTLTKKLTLLYVEDNLDLQRQTAKYLKKFFALVTVASDGLEGLEKFKTNKFDLVITDLSMPKMDGIEMIKKIKNIDELQAILITTAHSDVSYMMSAMKSHIDGYILKPLNFDELNFELYKIANRIQKFKENESYKKYLKDMLQKQTQEINDNYEKTLYSMVELIEQRETYTAGHSRRVAYYCELIAKEMGYSAEQCTLIHQAGILHDIGKIETPDSVLLSPNKLNDLEYSLIKEHVNVGYKLLSNIPMFQAFSEIVNAHHERYDGKGYPNGLKGDEIHELARIMIVADAFDAMTTNRIYKGRKSTAEAIKEILSLSKKQFHPEVVKSAVKVLKNIILDTDIDQQPKTTLEKARFAYFYSDTVTAAYNQNYLDIMLLRNSYDFLFKNMLVFSLINFSTYNKENSWEQGDSLLKEFAAILMTHLDNELVFRVFGDDFVVLSENSIEDNDVKKVLDTLAIKYRTYSVDLTTHKIEKLADIEMIQAS